MTRQRDLRPATAVLALLALGAAGCTASGPAGAHAPVASASHHPAGTAAAARPPATLDAFRSCADAVAGLRRATSASVTSYGLAAPADVMYSGPASAVAASGVATAPRAEASAGSGTAGYSGTPAYSGTNVAVAGVDEPDLVKTDGRRIVTVAGSSLIVVDAATRRVTGTLSLGGAGVAGPPTGPGAVLPGAVLPGAVPFGGSPDLLLSGDHALVLVDQGPATMLYLVDLSASPRVISSYSISGQLLDARLVGSVVRVVTQTAPRIIFPVPQPAAPQARALAANRAAVARAAIGAWLPSYTSTGGGQTIRGTVPCTSVSRPARYSGTSLLTVETFDLSASALGTGQPVSIEADGTTVYGTASSLYIASGSQWDAVPVVGGEAAPAVGGVMQPRQQTRIYRFDITQPGPPRFAASGAVPGYLVDQYALSEWNGYLRVATTTGLSWALADGPSPAGATAPPSSSAVYELSLAGPSLRIAGKVAGLGSGERIYSVRFVGPVGYVVTFRQTDPLYTVDLSDPVRPRVVGSLALTGYSAYLHPVSATELIGIGQQADAMGHVGGMQVSLFSVADLASPARLATYALPGAFSPAESDPHAFLYWPAASLLVVPLDAAQNGDLVLRLSGSSLVLAGQLQQPGAQQGYPIERSLVIGQTLWTLSPAGLMASSLATLHQQAWLPELPQ